MYHFTRFSILTMLVVQPAILLAQNQPIIAPAYEFSPSDQEPSPVPLNAEQRSETEGETDQAQVPTPIIAQRPVAPLGTTQSAPLHSLNQAQSPTSVSNSQLSEIPAPSVVLDVPQILDAIARENGLQTELSTPWWQELTTAPISQYSHPLRTGIDDFIQLALMNSAKLKVAGFLPSIRKTAVIEAQAAFDWNTFANAMWRDTSDPVGSSLTVGGSGFRFRDHDLDTSLGFRRRTFSGGNLELLSELGYQDNNSTFFIPNDQATSRLVLRYTQPLRQGRGQTYNRSLIVLAAIDVQSAGNEYARQLQSHLLEVTRAYWALYLERANLAQKIRLFQKTGSIAEVLAGRVGLDAAPAQVARAQAALESRKADLIRARAAVKNAETRLRALVNAPEFTGSPESIEFLPIDHPINNYTMAVLEDEFQTAMHNRPEIRAAFNSIRAACIRLNMAKNEILPTLNLITEAYVAGLRGDAEFGNAWLDQFRQGEPSYSAGLEFNLPNGRRASKARLTRRQLEMSQLQQEYRNVLELTRAEVEVAVRELETSHRELFAKHRALEAAELEAETIRQRWKNLPQQNSDAGLVLDSLLRAQERVTQSEFEFAQAQLTYNLAIINVRHANGTLFQSFPAEVYGSSNGATLESPPLPQAVVPEPLAGDSQVPQGLQFPFESR